MEGQQEQRYQDKPARLCALPPLCQKRQEKYNESFGIFAKAARLVFIPKNGIIRAGGKAMPYFYTIMWFMVGLILIFAMSKENKIFLLAGAFFLLLGGWWLANELLPDIDMFAGGWGIGLRCITGAALVILSVAFIKEYKKKGKG